MSIAHAHTDGLRDAVSMAYDHYVLGVVLVGKTLKFPLDPGQKIAVEPSIKTLRARDNTDTAYLSLVQRSFKNYSFVIILLREI